MRLLTLVLLLPALASAQGLTTKAPGQAGQKRTNYAQYSNGMSSGAAAVAPWVLAGGVSVATDAGVPAYAGGGTWATVTSTGNTQNFNQPVTTPSATTFTGSAWAVKVSGTGPAVVFVGCGAPPSTCTCKRSDGGTCSTAVLSANYCAAAVTDLGTTPVRISATAVCSSAITNPVLLLTPATFGTSTGTTRFAGGQLEVGVTTPSKLCVTTTAAKTCTN